MLITPFALRLILLPPQEAQEIPSLYIRRSTAGRALNYVTDDLTSAKTQAAPVSAAGRGNVKAGTSSSNLRHASSNVS